jgi:hypothetical protein
MPVMTSRELKKRWMGQLQKQNDYRTNLYQTER